MVDNSSDYLVVEDPKKPSTWHLQVRKGGKPDHRLMGAAWAALHGGYRGNKYQGPKADEALSKLTALYKSEKMDTPGKSIGLSVFEFGKALSAYEFTQQTYLKKGSRHSAVDQSHLDMAHAGLDQAAMHLVAAGAATYGTPPAKPNAGAGVGSVTSTRSLPADMGGMDAGQYAQAEGWDVVGAADALRGLAQLACGEACQGDSDGLASVIASMRSLLEFIDNEIGDLEGAAGQDDATDGQKCCPECDYVMDGDCNFCPECGCNMQMPSMMSFDFDDLIAYGEPVKALGGGKIGGYLVRYGNENEPDLSASKDFFTEQTYFGAHNGDGCDVTINHGIPLKSGKDWAELADVLLPPMKTAKDKIGIFAETICNMADDYQKMVYDLASKGKLSWSSGVLSHQMKRTPMKNGTNRIDRWIIGEGALTPIPAEPRLGALVPLKSLAGLKTGISDETPAPAPDGTHKPASTPSTKAKEQEMTPEELEAIKANTEATLALKKVQDELLAEAKKPALPAKALTQSEPPTPKGKDENPFKAQGDSKSVAYLKGLGENIFAIRDKALGQATEVQINKLAAVKSQFDAAVKATGANELIGSEGGDLVHTEFSNEIFQRAYTTGQVTSRCAKQLIGAGASGLKIPAVDEQSRADGSRFGGIRAYWAAEAATATKSKPTWRQVVFELKKLIAVVYATDELERDATAFGSFLMRTLPLEIGFKADDMAINGLGGGFGLGMLVATALVSVSKETGQAAATIVWENVKKMRARMWAPSWMNSVWYINQDALPQLYSMAQVVGVGGVPVFLPANGASGSPYDTLFGRPVIPIEQCQTIGTVGDIIYADPSQYAIADHGDGINVAQSIHVQFLTDEMTYRWTYRLDGQPLWNTSLTPAHGTNTLSPFVALATRS